MAVTYDEDKARRHATIEAALLDALADMIDKQGYREQQSAIGQVWKMLEALPRDPEWYQKHRELASRTGQVAWEREVTRVVEATALRLHEETKR